jgi:hypothetical protein
MAEDTKAKQLAIAERLQLRLLEVFEEKLKSTEGLSDTGMATLARLLMQNGWSIDPARLPQGLKDKLLTNVDPSKFTDDDVDVVGRIVA